MPAKKGADRRKGRRNRNIGGGNGSNASTSSGSVGTSSSASVKTSPQQTRGRSTKNSRQGRNNPPRASSAAAHSHSKKSSSARSSRNQTRSKHSPDQPIYFTSPDGELYKPGDFAYVDSQQSDLPFHICLIRNFKLARKESIIAEVKWFYRVSELPEAVYCLLMDDRKKSKCAASFELEGVKERELFTAFNIDTHPASLFKGKCVVKEIADIKNLSEYLDKDNHFFYQHGYKPESRRITQLDEFSIIPQSQQAILPDLVNRSDGLLSASAPMLLPFQIKKETESGSPKKEADSSSPIIPKHQTQTTAVKEEEMKEEPVIDRYGTDVDKKLKATEELVWLPSIGDEELLMYLRAARSVALHAGVFINGLMRDGYMAASSDETTQHAFDVLHRLGYNTEAALLDIVKKPIVDRLYNKKNWSKENSLLFAKGMRQFGKNFHKIKKELLPNKEIHELVEYYYYWKKTNAGLSSRNTRKQRKQTHIRMSRSILKQPEVSPEREFIDLSSASEDEVENEDQGDKCLSFHACRHCYTTASTSWHHGGSSKAILCTECRLHFQRYGFMRGITAKRDPPDFMFKDYHLALAEESGRKTRNSNGIRLPRTGLRNGKVFSKSDSDDEDEGEITDTSEFSSTESTTETPSVNNPKSLQSRRSLLDLLHPDKMKLPSANLPSSSNTSVEESEGTIEEMPSSKRPKMDENEGNESDDEASGDSTTNGDAEDEAEAEGDNRSQQSQEEKDSSSQSPESNIEGRNIPHVPSVLTPSATATLNKELLLEPAQEPVLDPVPQQFKRIRQDNECTCARTDLVYVHPPAHEKKAITDPQKAVPAHLPQVNFGASALPQPHPIVPPTSSNNHPPGFPVLHPQLPHLPPAAQPRPGIPTITPHDPHLPSFINFPGPPPPVTPLGTPFVNVPGSTIGLQPQTIGAVPAHAAANEKEMMWRMKQQQQQLEMTAAAQAQVQTTAHHMPPGIHFHPTASVPHSHPPGTTVVTSQQQPQQQLIFQFPNMEEMTRVQQRHGLPEGLTIMPATQYPQLVATTPGLPLEARPVPDDQTLPAGVHFATLHPGISLEMLQQQQALLHQQQQQHQQIIGHMPESIELQQQVEAIVQQSQKDPNIMFHPHVRAILSQYQAAQEMYANQQQQQHMQELMMQQLQQQQQELLKQQHKQQQQQQSKYHQGQATMRPGVIIGHPK